MYNLDVPEVVPDVLHVALQEVVLEPLHVVILVLFHVVVLVLFHVVVPEVDQVDRVEKDMDQCAYLEVPVDNCV